MDITPFIKRLIPGFDSFAERRLTHEQQKAPAPQPEAQAEAPVVEPAAPQKGLSEDPKKLDAEVPKVLESKADKAAQDAVSAPGETAGKTTAEVLSKAELQLGDVPKGGPVGEGETAEDVKAPDAPVAPEGEGSPEGEQVASEELPPPKNLREKIDRGLKEAVDVMKNPDADGLDKLGAMMQYFALLMEKFDNRKLLDVPFPTEELGDTEGGEGEEEPGEGEGEPGEGEEKPGEGEPGEGEEEAVAPDEVADVTKNAVEQSDAMDMPDIPKKLDEVRNTMKELDSKKGELIKERQKLGGDPKELTGEQRGELKQVLNDLDGVEKEYRTLNHNENALEAEQSRRVKTVSEEWVRVEKAEGGIVSGMEVREGKVVITFSGVDIEKVFATLTEKAPVLGRGGLAVIDKGTSDLKLTLPPSFYSAANIEGRNTVFSMLGSLTAEGLKGKGKEVEGQGANKDAAVASDEKPDDTEQNEGAGSDDENPETDDDIAKKNEKALAEEAEAVGLVEGSIKDVLENISALPTKKRAPIRNAIRVIKTAEGKYVVRLGKQSLKNYKEGAELLNVADNPSLFPIAERRAGNVMSDPMTLDQLKRFYTTLNQALST